MPAPHQSCLKATSQARPFFEREPHVWFAILSCTLFEFTDASLVHLHHITGTHPQSEVLGWWAFACSAPTHALDDRAERQRPGATRNLEGVLQRWSYYRCERTRLPAAAVDWTGWAAELPAGGAPSAMAASSLSISLISCCVLLIPVFFVLPPFLAALPPLAACCCAAAIAAPPSCFRTSCAVQPAAALQIRRGAGLRSFMTTEVKVGVAHVCCTSRQCWPAPLRSGMEILRILHPCVLASLHELCARVQWQSAFSLPCPLHFSNNGWEVLQERTCASDPDKH